MNALKFVKGYVFDVVTEIPSAFLIALPHLINAIFDAALWLSNHGQPDLAIKITNELCLTSRVDEWQGANDA